MEIEFTPGEFQAFRATNKIHLGEIQKDLPQGTIVEFDGQTLKWGTETFNVPQLVAGIRAGWLVHATDTTSVYVPQPAGVRVRPATAAGTERGEPMRMEEASEDEVVVGTLEASQTKRAEAQSKEMAANRQAAIHEVPEITAVVSTSKVTVTSPVPADIEYTPAPPSTPGMTMGVIQEGDQNEGAVAVASIKTSAQAAKVTVSDASAASRAISALDNKPPPRPRQLGVTQITEGEDIRTVKDGATGDVSESRSSSDLAGLLPDAVSSGVPEPGLLLTDGTRWVMGGPKSHWRTRVAKVAAEYADRPDIARQILDAESPNVAKHMLAALAKKGVKV